MRICWSLPLWCIEKRKLKLFLKFNLSTWLFLWNYFFTSSFLIHWRKLIDILCFYFLPKAYFVHARRYTPYSTVNRYNILNNLLSSQSHSVTVHAEFLHWLCWCSPLEFWFECTLQHHYVKALFSVFLFVFFTFLWTCFRSRIVNICESAGAKLTEEQIKAVITELSSSCLFSAGNAALLCSSAVVHLDFSVQLFFTHLYTIIWIQN